MESIRRPSGRRVLLPYEVDMCEMLGITPDDYWDFIFAAQEHLKERDKAYELVPDIRNDPVSIVTTLVIGIALSAIGALLTPKPKAPSQDDRRADLAIAGSQGKTRFTRSSNFDSVQELARLGTVVPLVFARHENGFGGVRVDSDMLFSQMVSSGNNQLLHAVLMLGMANMQRPDFDGLAVGDLLVRDFSAYKSRLYFRNQGRMRGTDKYSESKLDVPAGSDNPDAFNVWWPRTASYQQYFSGARTPSTKTQFGCYSPIPNGHRFYVPYELVMVLDGSGDNKDAARRKRYKIAYPFPRKCGVVAVQGNGTFVVYKISGGNSDPNPSDMKPWGAADANSIQDETRVNADDILKENQEFMIGQSICTLFQRPSPVFDPRDGKDAWFKFRITEKVGSIPLSGDIGENDLGEGGAYPWGRGTVQRVAIASLSNNRPCDATEIGIKSEVWRRMVGAANFNGHPSPDVIESYEEDGSNITLGTVTKYMARYSMFKLYARELGADKWIDLNGDKPFAVRGTSPVPHYNTIHINHSGTSMHEYKIVPVPGSAFYDKWLAGKGVGVHMLDGSMFKPLSQNGAEPVAISVTPYRVYYTGKSGTITATQASNPEWIMNNIDDYEYKKRGPIAGLSKYNNNKQPLIPTVELPDRFIDEQYEATGSKRSLVQRLRTSTGIENRFYWEGLRLTGTIDGRTITVTKGDKTFLYEDGDRKQPFEEASWGDTVTDFIVELSSESNRRVIYYTCVYLNPISNFWSWRWDNETISYQKNKTNSWIYKDNNTTRYKIGEKVGDKEEKWYDDAPTDIYKAKGVNNINIVDGVRLLPDGKYEFHRNDKMIGRSTTRNLRINSSTRWRATTLVQTAREYAEEFINQVRRVLNGGIGNTADVVVDGYVVKPDRFADGRRNVRIFVNGEKLYSGPDPYNNGKRVRIRVGDIVYEGNWQSDHIKVGPAEESGRANCFKLKRFAVQDARYEEWAMTKQQSVLTGERYAIIREVLDQGQDGHWSIKKQKSTVQNLRRLRR